MFSAVLALLGGTAGYDHLPARPKPATATTAKPPPLSPPVFAVDARLCSVCGYRAGVRLKGDPLLCTFCASDRLPDGIDAQILFKHASWIANTWTDAMAKE